MGKPKVDMRKYEKQEALSMLNKRIKELTNKDLHSLYRLNLRDLKILVEAFECYQM